MYFSNSRLMNISSSNHDNRHQRRREESQAETLPNMYTIFVGGSVGSGYWIASSSSFPYLRRIDHDLRRRSCAAFLYPSASATTFACNSMVASCNTRLRHNPIPTKHLIQRTKHTFPLSGQLIIFFLRAFRGETRRDGDELQAISRLSVVFGHITSDQPLNSKVFDGRTRQFSVS